MFSPSIPVLCVFLPGHQREGGDSPGHPAHCGQCGRPPALPPGRGWPRHSPAQNRSAPSKMMDSDIYTLMPSYSPGLLSCCMSVLYCAAPLASVVTVIRTRSTESLPFYLILATMAMTASWTLYGFIIEDTFVILPNLLGCLIASGQLLLFIVYNSSNIKPEK